MFSLPFFEQFCWCTLPIFSSTCHEYCQGTCSICVVNHDPSQNRRNADLSNAWEHWKLELAPGGCIFHGTVSCLERFAFWSFYLPFLWCEIFDYFFSSRSLKMREKIYQFCSVCIFFEGSLFTFQFLNEKFTIMFFWHNCEIYYSKIEK